MILIMDTIPTDIIRYLLFEHPVKKGLECVSRQDISHCFEYNNTLTNYKIFSRYWNL